MGIGYWVGGRLGYLVGVVLLGFMGRLFIFIKCYSIGLNLFVIMESIWYIYYENEPSTTKRVNILNYIQNHQIMLPITKRTNMIATASNAVPILGLSLR